MYASIVYSVTEQHVTSLVGMAVALCLFASCVAFGLAHRSRGMEGRAGAMWLGAIAIVAGSAVWATHFIAMLAYRPGLPFGFDFGLTAASFFAAIIFAGAGFHMALHSKRHISMHHVLGGIIAGAGIAAMHHMGMHGLVAPAVRVWNGELVVLSLALGVAGAAVAFFVGLGRPGWRGVALGGGLLTAAIATLHFTSMAALELRFDPAIEASMYVRADESFAAVVAGVTILIAIVARTVDAVELRKVRNRAGQAEKLQQYVDKLKKTSSRIQEKSQRLSADLHIQSSILNALPGNIALLDRSGKIISVNHAWKSFALDNGLRTPDFGLNINYLEIARGHYGSDPENADQAVSAIESVLSGREKAGVVQYPCHGPDKQRWFELYVAPVGEAITTGVVVMHLDVTKKVLAGRKLEASERRLRAIVENSGDAILTLDGRGVILSSNPVAEKCFSRRGELLRGRHIHDLLPSLPFFRGDGAFVSEMPEPHRGEYLGQRRCGTRFAAEISMSAVPLPEEMIFVIALRDMSDQRAIQEQLVQASKLSILGEMAAGMAHELNQPLSVMRMSAENALMRLERGKADTPYLMEALELIGGQAAKMGEMILNLKIFARREEDAEQKVFDPVVAANAACHLLGGKIQLDGISLDLDLPKDGGMVRGAGNQLEQVVINLLANAHDAIMARRRAEPDRRGDQIRVRIADEEAEMLCITVDDTGDGIPSDVMPKLFNPFFTTKPPGKGTGLGLSISYGIITAMGGSLEAHNTGDGARFIIKLPLCKPEQESLPHAGDMQLIEPDMREIAQ